jgi:hypothetical protein
VTDMRSALALHCGGRADRPRGVGEDWGDIARKHYQIYANLVGGEP